MLIPKLVAPKKGQTLIEVEKELEEDALRKGVSFSLVARYMRILMRGNETFRRKAFLAVWAVALVFLSKGSRKKIVYSQRSPVNRGASLRAVVRLILGT